MANLKTNSQVTTNFCFEMLKLNIGGETIDVSFRKAKDRHKIEANLMKQITNFEKSLLEFSNIGDTAGIAQTEKNLEKAKLQLVQVREPLVQNLANFSQSIYLVPSCHLLRQSGTLVSGLIQIFPSLAMSGISARLVLFISGI